MDHFLPDWMFAAFAIGGWELFHFLARRFNVPQLTWVSWAIVVVCALVLAIRYITRLIRKRRQKGSKPDDEEWKNY
ncbi:hypothetical protein [Alicyclobacillus sp. SO9]|uniref:hypothetical protein n=1 Tax=Alicyclobacillus sp. SO9 TaxID=2665646 RepID=UPI0018E89AE4|nr:hypothetical protein [Alicyclobacillus sp. SO9]QQE77049.1 hypothetical protein GI364_13795 [Alicyclobacillus sp. SO9]